MRRFVRAAKFSFILPLIQMLSGCAWINSSDAEAPLSLKIATPIEQATPCLASSLGREFLDTLPVIDRGITPGAQQITVNAPRGGIVAFVTVEPFATGGSKITFYNGALFWPRHRVSGVLPDIARDNWHRAERAIRACDTPATVPS